jgi:hypothetical protein
MLGKPDVHAKSNPLLMFLHNIAALFLFLPMFDGANVVFRRVLVPLCGQYEEMLLHDAFLVRKGVHTTTVS